MTFVNSRKLINGKNIAKFFKFFLKAEIGDTMDLSLNPYNEMDFLFYKDFEYSKDDYFFTNDFKDAIFLNSFNKTFNGIVEMLHYNSKIRFPKRFLLLKKNESSLNSFF